jgi:hypothetical protein
MWWVIKGNKVSYLFLNKLPHTLQLIRINFDTLFPFMKYYFKGYGSPERLSTKA